MKQLKNIVFIILTVWGGVLLLPGLAEAAPSISGISDNRSIYTNSQIPKYEKLEVTFQVGTTATNLQWPYAASTPNGIPGGTGISVDTVFTSPSGKVYTVPAFYYQDFDYQVKDGQDWTLATNNYAWKARFAPDELGNWSYRLTARDASGTVQSGSVSFGVISSSNHGFVKVAQNDSRYFEFSDGTYFPALGYNMNFDQITWNNFVQGNINNFSIMGQNGIQLVRMWLSQWSIFGSMWGPWRSMTGGSELDGIERDTQNTNHEFSMYIDNADNRCMMLGWMKRTPSVKANTNYRVTVKYRTAGMAGPVSSGQDWGFGVKIGDWYENCYQAGVGTVVTSLVKTNTSGYQTLTGSFNSGSRNFMQNFYLVMQNTSGGKAWVDEVRVEEDLGNGQYGANVISKSTFDEQNYFDQQRSFAFDKTLELAHQHGVYLRPVLLEKNDFIFDRIGWDGNYTDNASNNNFYGNWYEVGRMRWLQQAWWRYVQARWGYSTNIHSWELLNEGDPYNGYHYALTDEMGKYMHCLAFGVSVGSGAGQKCTYSHPNSHLVNTSFWTNFPTNMFWENADFPNVDFADVHQYIFQGSGISLRVDRPNEGSTIAVTQVADFYDPAAETQKLSMQIGAKQTYGTKKPVIRGETGWVVGSTDGWICDLVGDSQGGWLRQFIWGQINSGGLIDSGNWYPSQHIYPNNLYCGGRGPFTYDLRPLYGSYYKFISGIPLNNGNYVEANASAPSGVRAWGQKDTVNNRAHLWIANANWRWNAQTPAAVSGTVTVSGFAANRTLPLVWWSTKNGQVIQTTSVTTNASGVLSLSVNSLTDDVAVKIGDYLSSGITPTIAPTTVPTSVPTATPVPKPGDADGDGDVDGIDYARWLMHYGEYITGAENGNFNGDSIVDGLDYAVWVMNYGT